MKKQSAFTMLELIITLVIISVLAVTAAPKFLTESNFSANTVRDQLIAELRVAQLRALNDHSNCYDVEIDATVFGIYQDTACDGSGYALVNFTTTLEPNVTVAIAGVTNDDATRLIRFDSLGKPSGGNCNPDNLCTLTIASGDTTRICIESEGYIHAC